MTCKLNIFFFLEGTKEELIFICWKAEYKCLSICIYVFMFF